ncbi:Uncharacterised protein [Mycobacteroides abscessus subsp. abscessus]|nr:Uncharacterised protein [Mycobacteroides abscessus subsp. abscessus]
MSHAPARPAKSVAEMPADPTSAAPWKNPPYIAYIAESNAKSTSAASPASAPK